MYVKSLPDIRKMGVLWGRRGGVDKSVDKFKGENYCGLICRWGLSPNAHVPLCTLRFGAGTSRAGDICSYSAKFSAGNFRNTI